MCQCGSAACAQFAGQRMHLMFCLVSVYVVSIYDSVFLVSLASAAMMYHSNHSLPNECTRKQQGSLHGLVPPESCYACPFGNLHAAHVRLIPMHDSTELINQRCKSHACSHHPETCILRSRSCMGNVAFAVMHPL